MKASQIIDTTSRVIGMELAENLPHVAHDAEALAPSAHARLAGTISACLNRGADEIEAIGSLGKALDSASLRRHLTRAHAEVSRGAVLLEDYVGRNPNTVVETVTRDQRYAMEQSVLALLWAQDTARDLKSALVTRPTDLPAAATASETLDSARDVLQDARERYRGLAS